MAAIDQPKNADRTKFEASDGGAEDPDYPRKIQVFEEWLLRHGAKFPKLTMQKYDDEVRGVHATGEITPDEIIVEVPLACLITVEMGKATDVGRAVLSADLELDAPKHVFLMLFMLIDRANESSHFKPYYDILPPTLSNMPIFWNEEELALLEGSYLLTQIEERNAAIENDFKAICDLCPGFGDIASLDDFKWARMCVCSRNFGIVVDGVRTSAMVPYADMLNHYRPRETKWTYEAGRRAFTITSLMHIGPGAQVYDSYGQKCNHRFLLNYGFAIENNRESDGFCPNEVPFRFELDPNDEPYDAKLPLWRGDGHHTKIVRVCVSDNDNTLLAFACLRVMVANREEMTALGNSASRMAPQQLKDVNMPISMRNERAALQLFSTMITEKLAAYPRSLAEDLELLSGSKTGPGGARLLAPFSNERHAVIQVAGEKEVLEHYRNHCRQALAALAVPIHDDAQYIRTLRGMEAAGVHILTRQYCGEAAKSEVNLCRRLERRRQQQVAASKDMGGNGSEGSGAGGDVGFGGDRGGAGDPSKPHIV